MTSFSDLLRSPVLMDGGLGTTIENEFGVNISDKALWSAHPLVENEELILEAHLAFLRSGCSIISTSTYQCDESTFRRDGFDMEEGEGYMRRAVAIADKARRILQSGVEGSAEQMPRILVALSLGPFGATLTPTQEFQGNYPPPYGSGWTDREDASIEALAGFHFKRLLVFSENAETWGAIDCIPFETVLLEREISAIRRAMGWLQDRVGQGKPWWVSCVFPSGGRIVEMFDAAFDEGSGGPCPGGFGINCTSVGRVPGLVSDLTRTVVDRGKRLWLVLYPNGGGTYDEEKRMWNVDGEKDSWCAEMCSILEQSSSVYEGVMVGGCCLTSLLCLVNP